MTEDWKTLSESLTPEALILRLKSAEHDFIERKSRNQKGDWLQTAVAFANSAPIGWPAVLFVGVDDDGKPQQQGDQLETLARSVSDVIGKQAYPPIYRHIVPLEIPDEGACLAVIVPGSPMRPHFAGHAYVRVGDSIKSASEEQFASLIAQRQSKAAEILRHLGETATLWSHERGYAGRTIFVCDARDVVIEECNSHWLTFRIIDGPLVSSPLEWTTIGFDQEKRRLSIYIDRSPGT